MADKPSSLAKATRLKLARSAGRTKSFSATRGEGVYDLCEICGGIRVAARHEPIGCQELPDCLAIPCPFCGSKQVSTQEDSQTGGKWGFVGCGCGARGPDVRTGYDFTPRAEWRADAVSQWNLALTIPSDPTACPPAAPQMLRALVEVQEDLKVRGKG